MTIEDGGANPPPDGNARDSDVSCSNARTMLEPLVRGARSHTALLLALDVVLAVLLAVQGSALFPACWFVVVVSGSLLHLLLMGTLPTRRGETLAQKQQLAAWSFAGQAVLRLTALLLFPSMPPSLQLGLTAYSLLVAIGGPRPAVAPLALLGTLPVALAWLLPLSSLPPEHRVSIAALLLVAGGLLARRRR